MPPEASRVRAAPRVDVLRLFRRPHGRAFVPHGPAGGERQYFEIAHFRGIGDHWSPAHRLLVESVVHLL